MEGNISLIRVFTGSDAADDGANKHVGPQPSIQRLGQRLGVETISRPPGGNQGHHGVHGVRRPRGCRYPNNGEGLWGGAKAIEAAAAMMIEIIINGQATSSGRR